MIRPKVKIEGDHSAYHCGSAAAFSALTRALAEKHDIVAGEDYDILYVNGEGSMHHNSGHFVAKMEAIKSAIDGGRKAYLVNTVWQENEKTYDSTLAKLSGVTVREAMSQSDLKTRHGIDADMFLDLSYYEELDQNAEHVDWSGKVLITDFFARDLGLWYRVTSGPLAARTYIDLRDQSWSSLIKSMRTCRAVITGRHHAMYAACVARRPFVAVAGSTHKVEGLKRASGFPLPVLASVREANATLRWAIDNREMFKEFFHWMDEFPRWTP
ncbi:polysaccharide pyruvyl transferase family protein [Methylobacterium sp. 77]|uniref:polysaccharide pyruvyl transferase family protein n=1 Tax=Methylobacterium sp. 77 TaxID=1101192 RepID=UPI00036D5405|nr:polysaccharide pyruvyl transferase family protein [Methylobacterium sp. 77]